MDFRAVIATTHRDLHGDRLTKDSLEKAVESFHASDHPRWFYWDHQTTLPPIALTTSQRVEQAEDGEYQLVSEGRLLTEENSEWLPQSNIKGLDVTQKELNQILEGIDPSPSGHLEISYDPRSFDSKKVEPVIESLSEIVDTKRQLFVRKSELPPAVIWVMVAFAGGFIARLGEVVADKMLATGKAFYQQLNERFAELLEKSNSADGVDVVFSVPISRSTTIVEGAVEEADREVLERVWTKLPELYAIATHLIDRNQKNYFSEMKFLFNPSTSKWEINYLTTRKTQQVILGPRYYNPTHPLRHRWETEVTRLGQLAHNASEG